MRGQEVDPSKRHSIVDFGLQGINRHHECKSEYVVCAVRSGPTASDETCDIRVAEGAGAATEAEAIATAAAQLPRKRRPQARLCGGR